MRTWKLSTGDILTSGKIFPYKERFYHDIKFDINTELPNLAKQVVEISPMQIFGEESDFTILLKNGDTVQAKYVGNSYGVDLS